MCIYGEYGICNICPQDKCQFWLKPKIDLKNISNDDLYKNFCDTVRNICKANEISFKELAKAIGLRPSQFSQKLCNKNMKFNLLQISRISKELDESIEDLIYGNVKLD